MQFHKHLSAANPCFMVKELTNSSPCFAPLPSVALLQDFCKQELAMFPAGAPRIIKDTVTAIASHPAEEGQPSMGEILIYLLKDLSRVVPRLRTATANIPLYFTKGFV